MSSSIDGKQECYIDLMKNYVLEHYLDLHFKIDFHELYFAVNDEKTIPGYEFSASDFLPGKYLDKVSPNHGFEKLNSPINVNHVGLQDDGKERLWFHISLKDYFLISDFLELLEESKKNSLIYFVYGHIGGGGSLLPDGIKIPSDVRPVEKNIVQNATYIFDLNHNFLKGFYNHFDICIIHEVSGSRQFDAKEILPSFYLNQPLFNLIDDENTINELNSSLPEDVEAKNRDWYSVTFPFKFEAQYALQLYKELEYNEGVFYVASSLCENESINNQVPEFQLWR